MIDYLFALLWRIKLIFKKPTIKEEQMTEKMPGTSEEFPKPPMMWKKSPNYSSRNGSRITHIVLHYTTSPSIEGTVSWFENPKSRVSAHYIVGKFGEIVNMVSDENKAWHAKKFNAHSIGIEHVAVQGEILTPVQSARTVDLIRYLVSEYKIEKENIVGHGFIDGAKTMCPGSIFGGRTEQSVKNWVKYNI